MTNENSKLKNILDLLPYSLFPKHTKKRDTLKEVQSKKVLIKFVELCMLEYMCTRIKLFNASLWSEL